MMTKYEPERAHAEGRWIVESQDPAMPKIEFRKDGDTLSGESGRYSFLAELEESDRTRVVFRKRGLSGRFADISIHHHETPGEWPFTVEATGVITAIVWSAVRRDQYPGADGGSDFEVSDDMATEE